ncbi:MAG: type II secretion system F family protein [Nanoarchaeota archaeon]|nr:type II secretion system F family protein [Nanoarchaeota archaeon]
MKFKDKYLIGIVIGAIILVSDLLFLTKSRYFFPLIILAVSIAWGQVWIDFFIENQRQREIETRFLDFVRNLAGAIKSGMPVSRSITHISNIDYGSLSPYVRKLGHQVEWSIPVHKALVLFSTATRNEVIKRTIATVIEAEQSGGNMEDVLESITNSLIEIKKIKEQRRASIQSQVMQSYIIFFIFIGVMLVIQNMLVPYLVGAGDKQSAFGSIGIGGSSSGSGPSLVLDVTIRFTSMREFFSSLAEWFSSIKGIFLMLSVIQGFFAGIIIGKLSEGDVTAGLKHSLILVTSVFFIMSLFT